MAPSDGPERQAGAGRAGPPDGDAAADSLERTVSGLCHLLLKADALAQRTRARCEGGARGPASADRLTRGVADLRTALDAVLQAEVEAGQATGGAAARRPGSRGHRDGD